MAKTPRTPRAKATAQEQPALAAATPAPVDAAPAGGDETAPVAASPPSEPPTGVLVEIAVASISAQGRRRAGRGFTREPVHLSVSEATLALLEGDPQLVVTRI